jgi:hypothetical protein
MKAKPPQTIYFAVERGRVLGFLKTGMKHLFYMEENGVTKEMDVLCVLDFYVHESMQRKGCGFELFNFMLQRQSTVASKLAYDRPSIKLKGFLGKYFKLTSFTPQPNNFVIFQDFFKGSYSEVPSVRSGFDYERDHKKGERREKEKELEREKLFNPATYVRSSPVRPSSNEGCIIAPRYSSDASTAVSPTRGSPLAHATNIAGSMISDRALMQSPLVTGRNSADPGVVASRSGRKGVDAASPPTPLRGDGQAPVLVQQSSKSPLVPTHLSNFLMGSSPYSPVKSGCRGDSDNSSVTPVVRSGAVSRTGSSERRLYEGKATHDINDEAVAKRDRFLFSQSNISRPF